MKWEKIIPVAFFLTLAGFFLFAQAPTQHGVSVTWVASSTPGVVYEVFRCTGTCGAGSTWTALCTASCTSTTEYLDPAGGLNPSTTYSYEVDAIDGNGNVSGPSNVATISIGASFPSNPGAPAGCQAKAQ